MVTIRRLSLICSAVALLCLSAYSASASELELAGIRLGRSAMTIIQKLGNPTEIRLGQAAEVAQESMPAPAPVPGPDMSGMPGMPGMPGPGMPGPGMNVPTRKGPPEVRWIYKFAKNKTLEFIINPDGRIMQIAAYGADWSSIKTAKGVVLGTSTYKDVLAKYGFPEAHDKAGVELMLKYTKKDRVIFTLVGQTVVGVTIGLMD